MCRRILYPVYDNEKENWRIFTNKEIYTSVKKPIIIETIGKIYYVGLDMTENGKKQNSQRSTTYEFGNNKIKR